MRCAVQVPAELVKMAEEFQSKVDSGQARKASSGFSGKGFTFDDSEQSESQQVTTFFFPRMFSPFLFVGRGGDLLCKTPVKPATRLFSCMAWYMISSQMKLRYVGSVRA